MKSYWIAGAVFLLTAWPSGSKAYVVGVDQSKADDKLVQQAQSSNLSANTQDSAKAQEPSVSARTAVATGPTANSPAAPSSQSKGSYMLVELSKSLKAKKLKPGDKVKAEVAQDVVSHGKVIIPVETELVGHVTEVRVRDSENSESRLGIVFDRIVLKHYHDINLQAVVQAVAPPVMRKSRVDEPSQMLPPSMLGGTRDATAPSGGRQVGQSANRTPPSTGGSASMSASTFQAPLTVKESPSTHTASGTSTAQPDTSTGGQLLSIGMPRGVTGLKGLSLSASPSASTPGPVIVSNTDNVKLESGTQILLHVLSVEPQKNAEKAK
jgi:hypothetical protein